MSLKQKEKFLKTKMMTKDEHKKFIKQINQKNKVVNKMKKSRIERIKERLKQQEEEKLEKMRKKKEKQDMFIYMRSIEDYDLEMGEDVEKIRERYVERREKREEKFQENDNNWHDKYLNEKPYHKIMFDQYRKQKERKLNRRLKKRKLKLMLKPVTN